MNDNQKKRVVILLRHLFLEQIKQGKDHEDLFESSPPYRSLINELINIGTILQQMINAQDIALNSFFMRYENFGLRFMGENSLRVQFISYPVVMAQQFPRLNIYPSSGSTQNTLRNHDFSLHLA